MGTRGKTRPGSDADHSSPFSVEVTNEWELYRLSPLAPAWRAAGQLLRLLYNSGPLQRDSGTVQLEVSGCRVHSSSAVIVSDGETDQLIILRREQVQGCIDSGRVPTSQPRRTTSGWHVLYGFRQRFDTRKSPTLPFGCLPPLGFLPKNYTGYKKLNWHLLTA
jgi:hypothetical protein